MLRLRCRSLPGLLLVALATSTVACDDEPNYYDPCSDPCAYSGPSSWPDGFSRGCVLPDRTIPLGPHSIELASFRQTNEGMNIDGLNNAPTTVGGRGKTIPGCGVSDAQGGVDAAFAGLVTQLSPTFGGLESLVPVDATSAAPLHFEHVLERTESPAVPRQGCVSSDVLLDGNVITQRYEPASNQTVYYTAPAPITFVLHPTIDPSACDGPCADASLVVRVDQAKFRLRFDETYSRLEAGSYVAGLVFFEETSDVDPARNAAGLKAELERFAAAAHLTTSATDWLVQVVAAHRDLRVNTDGSIGVCTSSTGTVADVNSNAISIGIAIASP